MASSLDESTPQSGYSRVSIFMCQLDYYIYITLHCTICVVFVSYYTAHHFLVLRTCHMQYLL